MVNLVHWEDAMNFGLNFANQLSISVEENVHVLSGCTSRLHCSRKKLAVFLFVCLLHCGRKRSEWISRVPHVEQDKTMSQAFHLEADNIPVTFPGKCQGLDGFIGLAGDTAQETSRGAGGSAFPSYAKEWLCDGGRAVTESVCKYVFTSMECQTGGAYYTGQDIHIKDNYYIIKVPYFAKKSLY